MTPTDQREALRWRLKPFPELVRLAWPITVSMLSYSIMTLVDTLFAGRLGAVALGAVGFGNVTTFTLICFGIGVLVAGNILVAQAVGAGRRDRIPALVGAALVVAVGLGLATAVVGQVLVLGLPLVAEGSAAIRQAQEYVTIRLLGAPLILVAFAIREVRTGLGDSQSPMRAAVIANLVHIPLNFVLMSGLGLGVLGIAVSTVLSQGLEMALLVFVQRSDDHGLGLGAWTRRDVSDFLRTGLPLGLERLFNVASFTVLVTIVARVSDVDLAAHQVAHQVNLFALLPMMAVAEAASVLSGQAVGAGETDLVRRVARIATGAGLAYGAFSAAVYVLFGSAVTHVLTGDENVAALSARLLWVAAACHVFTAAYLVAGSVLRGAGDIRYATWAMVIIAWVVTPPLAVHLGIRMGLGALGGWLSLLVEWGVGAVVLVLRVERLGWLPAAIRARARLTRQVDTDVPVVELARS